ncbi:MAG: hypothetical protein HUK19_01905, partial [Fibrobacter sp.]|nr:hypothetical protein [Fibrobacter sp.]
WIDIDYVEFTKVGSSSPVDTSTSSLKNIRMNVQDAGSTLYFDMNGNRISKASARNAGVYLVRIPGGKTFMMRNEK